MKLYLNYFDLIIKQSDVFDVKSNLNLLYNLEKDIYNFIYFDKGDELIREYPFNIFKLINDIDYNIENEPISIKIIRLSSQKIRVKRIA